MIFDQKLIYKYHIIKVAKKDINVALTLKQLKNLKPKITHQLFISTVISIVNYILSI